MNSSITDRFRQAFGYLSQQVQQLDTKKVYYPTRKDEEAINPNGSRLRAG